MDPLDRKYGGAWSRVASRPACMHMECWRSSEQEVIQYVESVESLRLKYAASTDVVDRGCDGSALPARVQRAL